jgi:methylated-DNA-[protein]-cysteine S-methyltransferase
MPHEEPLQFVAFETDLGWMALVGAGKTIRQVIFGHATKAATLKAIREQAPEAKQAIGGWPSLVVRLQDYAAGGCVDFQDVELDLEHLTPFQRRVIKHCRAIGYGQTQSYGDLAAKSGAERAARAVGSTMAKNRFPILVPCHRVINSNGNIGHYSAPEGPGRKAHLLELEGARTGRSARASKARRSPQAVASRG